MLVVADTSPIHVLVRIDQIAILPALFRSVLVPSLVEQELLAAKYRQVREFIASCPDWLQIANPSATESIPRIHPGEEAAISLAREIDADVLLLDDHDARKEAM